MSFQYLTYCLALSVQLNVAFFKKAWPAFSGEPSGESPLCCFRNGMVTANIVQNGRDQLWWQLEHIATVQGGIWRTVYILCQVSGV